MKKLILPAVLSVFVFVACQRAQELFDRVPLPPGVDSSKYISHDTSCEVIAQSSAYIEEEPRSQVAGFRKVINAETGRVDSLITATGGLFDLDSFFYSFEYIYDTVIDVYMVDKTYNRLNDQHLWELDNANILLERITLNSEGHIKTAANDIIILDSFTYQNGRLISIDYPHDPVPANHTQFTYDNNGNLKEIFRGDEMIYTSISFEYDPSRTAISQIYTPVPGIQLYELMGWIPIAPKNLRTRYTMNTHAVTDNGISDRVLADVSYSNHVINEFGALHSFDVHNHLTDADATITNTLTCEISRETHLPR